MSLATPKDRKTSRSILPLYPILFGIYPVLALIAYNITEIDLPLTYRSLALTLALCFGVFASTWLITRSRTRAAMLTFLLLILFFSYGQVYSLVKNMSLFGFAFGRHRLLAVVWAGLAALAIWVSSRDLSRLSAATAALNLITAALLILPIARIVEYEATASLHRSAVGLDSLTPTATDHQPFPDVYYIILDGYMRADYLQTVYAYDNSAFVNALVDRGFYVASCSQSNYAFTELSLASSLNMDYDDSFLASGSDALLQSIQTGVVRRFLVANGYTTFAFETGYAWTQWEDADYYFTYRPNAPALNGFEFLYLQTTLVRIPLDYMNMVSHPTTFEPIHHDRIVYSLATLKNLPGLAKGPKFVFAHLVVPHPPYVFAPDGSLVTQWTEDSSKLDGYRNAVTFINREILQVVDRILSQSKIPPVIIIQGDHGAPYFKKPVQRMSILNAYYAPRARASLYPTITPVNTFRIILDSYFGQSLPTLDDKSWYSALKHRFDFQLIPNDCHG